MLPKRVYTQVNLMVETGSRLCVLSDGAFEFTTQAGTEWTFPEFLATVRECAAEGTLRADTLHARITSLARNHTLDDDFSLMILNFV
jgi:serine phosphatase RsbU (regulator of sigma subunit)